MPVYFSNSTNDQAPGPVFFKALIFKSLKYLRLNKEKIIIDLAIVSKGEMRRLNKKYRGQNMPTDVLSFSFMENDIKLGQIVICLAIAKKDARKENISLKEKLAKLTIHGLFHLLGYDHEKRKEKEKMERLEKNLWQKVILS